MLSPFINFKFKFRTDFKSKLPFRVSLLDLAPCSRLTSFRCWSATCRTSSPSWLLDLAGSKEPRGIFPRPGTHSGGHRRFWHHRCPRKQQMLFPWFLWRFLCAVQTQQSSMDETKEHQSTKYKENESKFKRNEAQKTKTIWSTFWSAELFHICQTHHTSLLRIFWMGGFSRKEFGWCLEEVSSISFKSHFPWMKSSPNQRECLTSPIEREEFIIASKEEAIDTKWVWSVFFALLFWPKECFCWLN